VSELTPKEFEETLNEYRSGALYDTCHEDGRELIAHDSDQRKRIEELEAEVARLKEGAK
jgi:hypothetical protein